MNPKSPVHALARRASLLLALTTLAAASAFSQEDTTLRELAKSRGIYMGAAVTFPFGNNADNRAEYERVLRTEFNGVVAENDMKFQRLSNERGVYNFGPADALVEFAEENDMVVRGHTLVWHSQAANWFNNLSGEAASRDTTLAIMKAHIDTVAGRYRGKIYEWDVVNEAIAQNGGESPNYRTNGSAWYSRIGPDFIDSAFVYAHRADSNALLFYNDFGGETMNAKSQNIYDLVSGLKERGIPIHGVGLQCHFNTGNVDTAAIGENMRRLAALGLRISLTEIDIANSGTVDDAKLATQKDNFKALMSLCLSVPACKSYYAWGVNDAQSWRGANAAALMFTGTSEITPKPAYFGVVEALQAAPAVAIHAASAPRADGRAAVRPALQRSRAGVGAVDARGALRDLRGRSLPESVRRAMQP